MDKYKDDYIKNIFSEDIKISDEADKVFKNFENNLRVINNDNNGNDKIKSINYKSEKNEDVLFYRKMNKYLSMAAAFLGVVLVGTGTLLYNKKPNIENINIVTTKSVVIKNEELQFSKEQILEYSENDLIKAYILDDKKVAIEFKEKFAQIHNLQISSDKQYEVYNITKNVKDIFVGCMIDEKSPYVMMVMEDGTGEYIQIIKNNYEFDFYAQKIQGLYDVVAFSQGKRFYYNSGDEYYYINAIRKDGKSKVVELNEYNYWDDNIDEKYNELNKKYLQSNENMNSYNNMTESNNINNNINNIENNNNADVNNISANNGLDRDDTKFESNNSVERENKSITDYSTNEKSEFEKRLIESKDYFYDSLVGHYWIQKKGDSNHAYNIENSELFRYNLETNDISWIASGVNDLYKDGKGDLICKLQKNYSIKEYDYNIIYTEYGITNSKVDVNYENNIVKIENKLDGSLTIRILENGLEKLGISKSETLLKENVVYNLYGEGFGYTLGNNGYKYAHSQIGILGFVGKENRLNFAYANKDNTIVCIDILNAILKNSFENAQCISVSNSLPVMGLSIGVPENSNNSSLDSYEVIFYKVKENNKEYDKKITKYMNQ